MIDYQTSIKKFIGYAFNRNAFKTSSKKLTISDHAFNVAHSIRGDKHPSSIIIHGITKRSGTVYLGELISLHPDVVSYPMNIWEFPFLSLSNRIIDIQKEFFFAYKENVHKIGKNDFLPVFGASLIRYLNSNLPRGKTLLIKIPGVQYLNLFYYVYPNENLICIIRDGRDVVSSTIKTWPKISFPLACLNWDRSAKMIIACHNQYNNLDQYLQVRFEDTVNNPQNTVSEISKKFGLNPSIYPYDRISSLPVIGSSSFIDLGKSWIKKPKDFNPIGRWKSWSIWKKILFKIIAGDSLKNLGYTDNLAW